MGEPVPDTVDEFLRLTAKPTPKEKPCMETPDIPRAQVVALATSLVGLATSFGVTLTVDQQASLLGVITASCSILVSLGLLASDASIRRARNKRLAEEAHAATGIRIAEIEHGLDAGEGDAA